MRGRTSSHFLAAFARPRHGLVTAYIPRARSRWPLLAYTLASGWPSARITGAHMLVSRLPPLSINYACLTSPYTTVCLDNFVGKQGIALQSYPLRGMSSLLVATAQFPNERPGLRPISNHFKHILGRVLPHTKSLYSYSNTSRRL